MMRARTLYPISFYMHLSGNVYIYQATILEASSLLRRDLPEQPAKPSAKLQSSRHPQRRLHTTATSTQPTTKNGTNEKEDHAPNAAVALDVGSRLIRDLGVGRNIKVYACQNDSRDLVVAQQPTAGHRTGRLEGKQGDGNELEEERSTGEAHVGRGVRDEVGLDEGDGDDDQDGLDKE